MILNLGKLHKTVEYAGKHLILFEVIFLMNCVNNNSEILIKIFYKSFKI